MLPEVVAYRLGNRSALNWVIDQLPNQHRVAAATSGITSDPNNPDDEECIVRLVGQVVPAVSLPNPRVSIETVKIVNASPPNTPRQPQAESRQPVLVTSP
jgi:predicted helicase